MDTKEYSCEYCHEHFIPKRRYVQRFCSTSCRVKAHHQKTKKSNDKLMGAENKNQDKTKIEKMSLAGVGNAAAGTFAANLLNNVFTSGENKPATKKDLKNLEQKLNRYQKITNLPPNTLGQTPYFDMELKKVVYLSPSIRF